MRGNTGAMLYVKERERMKCNARDEINLCMSERDGEERKMKRRRRKREEKERERMRRENDDEIQ